MFQGNVHWLMLKASDMPHLEGGGKKLKLGFHQGLRDITQLEEVAIELTK